MNRYTPLFSSVVDSSIWDEEDYVVKIFITMLVLQDADHVVRLNAYNLGKRAKKTEAEVLKALKILASPDKKRLEPQPHEGRRIQRVEEGWLLLNGAFYIEAMRKANRNAYQAAKQRQYRAIKKGVSLKDEKEFCRADGDGEQSVSDEIVTRSLPAGSRCSSNAQAMPKQCQKSCLSNATSPSETHVPEQAGGARILEEEPDKPKPDTIAAFEKFWEVYPKKWAQEDAKHAFVEVGACMCVSEILKALRVQKGSREWQEKSGRYIPAPAKWLREKRWIGSEIDRDMGSTISGGVVPAWDGRSNP